MKRYLVAAAIAMSVASSGREADASANAAITCYSVTLSPTVNIAYDAIRTSIGADVFQTINVSFLCDVSNLSGKQTATATLALTSTTHAMTNPANSALPLSYNLYLGASGGTGGTVWGSGSAGTAAITATFTANGNSQPTVTAVTVRIPGGQSAYKGTYSDSPQWTLTASIN